MPQQIDRAVSLAPNITEMVFAVGAGDRLVGDTTYCDYPEEAKAIQKVGDTLNPNIETIISLKPDVILVSSASQLESFTTALEQNGIAVFVTAPASINDVLRNLKQFGELFGTQDKADQVVAEQQRRMASVEDKLFHADGNSEGEYKPIPVFLQISKEPLFTVGKKSLLTEIIEHAGGHSVTDKIDTAYPKLSKETALALAPEAIILSDSPDNQGPNEVFKNSPAVMNGRIYRINADIISRPGPRLVNALEQIARDLHPEKFR